MNVRPLTPHKWNGFSLEELKARQAVNDKRIELCKADLENSFAALKASGNTVKTISGKVFSALSYMDYVVLALTVIRKVRSLITRFRK